MTTDDNPTGAGIIVAAQEALAKAGHAAGVATAAAGIGLAALAVGMIAATAPLDSSSGRGAPFRCARSKA